jgi:hypothetical protein
MEAEVAGMEDVRAVIGSAVSFDRRVDVGTARSSSERRGYVDSSIHPMSLTPLFKFLHWWNTSAARAGIARRSDG